jgi:hypothetical protein
MSHVGGATQRTLGYRPDEWWAIRLRFYSPRRPGNGKILLCCWPHWDSVISIPDFRFHDQWRVAVARNVCERAYRTVPPKSTC